MLGDGLMVSTARVEETNGKGTVGERRLLVFRDEKELRVANTWFQKYRIVTHSAGENMINNDFVLVSADK